MAEFVLFQENELIASVHLAYGAASGVFVQKRLPIGFKTDVRCAIAFLVGVFSHMILDAWPHWEYTQTGPWLWAILLLETLLVFLLIFGNKSKIMNYVIFCGMIGGALPDVSLMIWDKVFSWNPFLYFHFATHIFHGSLPFFEMGLVFQIFIAAVAIIYVRLKSA